MSKRWHHGLAILMGALTSGAVLAQSAPPDALVQKVRALCGELDALGMKLPAESVALEVRPAREFEAVVAREQELLLGKGYFDALFLMREALAMDSGKSADDLRAQLAHRAAQGVVCRYDLEHGKLVFAAETLETAANQELAIVHELARAWRDQQSDVVAWFASEPRTTEMARVRQCWLEGLSELTVLAVQQARAGKKVEHLQPDALVGLEPLATEDRALRLARSAGRDAWLRLVHEQGWSALAKLSASPPPSTEQLLHHIKLGQDQPREVVLPPWPANAGVAEIVRDDTLGELELLALLLDAGVDDTPAQAAAIGWDGDRLQLVRAKSGELAVVWRIEFDRIEDSRQFGVAWTSKAHGQMGARGQLFEWIRSDSVRLSNALGDALQATSPDRVPDPTDRQTTEILERGLTPNQEAAPRVEGDRWIHPRFGVSIAVPVGWNAGVLNGQSYLMGEPDVEFRDLIGVVAIENPEGKTLAKLLDEHRTFITKGEGNKLVTAEQRRVGGKDVIYLRYDVRVDAQKLLHMTSVSYLLGAKEVIVTATIGDRTWAGLAPVVEKVLGGLVFLAPQTAPRKDGR